MAANKTHNPQQSAALRAQIYTQFCCGKTQAAIAAALGMHQSNVAYHVKHARAAHNLEAEARRRDRLAELDSLRSQCWKAWEADHSHQGTAFLAQIQKAIAQERALLGLDAQKSLKAEVTFEELPNDTLDSVVEGPQEP